MRRSKRRTRLRHFHSIASSARASSVGGTSMSSALAVLMLITNSSGVVLSKTFEQNFGVHQIGRVKPLVKPTIERGQQVETLPCSSLQPPESG